MKWNQSFPGFGVPGFTYTDYREAPSMPEHPKECAMCMQADALKGWIIARTIFAEPMLTYLHASMKDKRCALDYQPNKV